MKNPLGANWKTTVSMVGGVLMGALTFLSTVSYDQGPIALVIPPKYKPAVAWIAGSAALILFIWNGVQQKSKDVTGGTQQQNAQGKVVPESKAKLVHITKETK